MLQSLLHPCLWSANRPSRPHLSLSGPWDLAVPPLAWLFFQDTRDPCLCNVHFISYLIPHAVSSSPLTVLLSAQNAYSKAGKLRHRCLMVKVKSSRRSVVHLHRSALALNTSLRYTSQWTHCSQSPLRETASWQMAWRRCCYETSQSLLQLVALWALRSTLWEYSPFTPSLSSEPPSTIDDPFPVIGASLSNLESITLCRTLRTPNSTSVSY